MQVRYVGIDVGAETVKLVELTRDGRLALDRAAGSPSTASSRSSALRPC